MKTLSVLFVAGVFIVGTMLAVVGVFGGSYNTLNTSYHDVETKWAQVENQFQRRYDLIPNLVETTKMAASFEKELFTNIAEARSKAGQTKVDISTATPEQLAEYQKSQMMLGSMVTKLMGVVEAYPQIKSNESFLNLQYELSGTENRIAVARNDFNKATQKYNVQVTSFPTNTIAGMFGFTQKPLFKADEAARTAPKVKFD